MAKPFRITSDKWPGLAKLVEECGEVIKDGAKIMGGEDSPDQLEHLEYELGDLYAALFFFTRENKVNHSRISNRSVAKLRRWTAKRTNRRNARAKVRGIRP